MANDALAGFRPFTGACPAFPVPTQASTGKAGSTIPGAHVAPASPFRRNTKRRQFLDAQNEANAVAMIGQLPDEDEVLHMVTGTTFHHWAVVPAVVALAKPNRILHLRLTTLSTNKGNSEALFDLLDSKQIGSASMVVSCYQRDSSNAIYGHLVKGMTDRGMKCIAARCHAKLQLFGISDGRHVVVESSANLRSNKNLEVTTLTTSKELHDFHAGWIDRLIELGDAR
jgi:hypothetical protein